MRWFQFREMMTMIKSLVMSEEVTADILKALNRGNTVELKIVNGKLHVIEVQRKFKISTSITG